MGRLQQRLQVLLQVGDTPHRIALSFAVGVFIAFSPAFGIHTGVSLLVAYLFRLNRVPILLGCWVNNPWTIAPMYMTGTLLGGWILGISPGSMPTIDWHLSGHSFRTALWRALLPYLWPFVIGNTILGLAGAALSYFLLRSFLERRKGNS
jgi:uncharacterized protein (DUF2062 family)